MVSKQQQKEFITLVSTKLTSKELVWVSTKTAIVSDIETSHKFKVFFSLVARFISSDNPSWDKNETETMEAIYPGFSKSIWSKQDLVRACLMIALDPSINKPLLLSFFEIAEMKEQVALYKGLYLLENASSFRNQVAEGIRTNMVNVFDAIASGNPYPKTYLDEDAWNQLILKSFFMDRKLYLIQYVDQGKNENLANMLQDYVKERWAAGRQVSLEIWRMINGYLREDIKALFSKRTFEGKENEVVTKLLQQNNEPIPAEFWDGMASTN